MGHLRLGRLPKTRLWREVVELLDTSSHDAEAIGRSVAAADSRLRGLADDASLTYRFLLPTRIARAARSAECAPHRDSCRRGKAADPVEIPKCRLALS